MRTFLAFIFGPLAPCVLFGIGQAFTQHVHEHMTWAASFFGYTLMAAQMAFLLSYTAGTLVFLILRCVKKEYVVCYCAGAILAGFTYGAVVGTSGDRMALGGLMATLATSAAIAFALIRGPDRKISPACPTV